MNNLLQRLMTKATQLTRNGQLHAATEIIQRALRSGEPGVFGSGEPAAASRPASNTAPAFPEKAAIVLDDLTSLGDNAEGSASWASASGASGDALAHDASAGPLPAGVDREVLPERWLDGSFTHQGRTLAYKLYVPPSLAGLPPTPRPLVLMLHGCTQGAEDFAAGTQMNALARELGVVVLYPEQTGHANAQKCWNWFKPQHQQRDRGEPALLAALTRSVMEAHQVDPARVYVAGLSAGGAMADIVGHCYPEVFAAIGVHSGLPSGAASDVMSALSVMRSGATAPAARSDGPARPVIVFHGDADTTVHPANGAAVVESARRRGRDAPNAGPAPYVAEGRSAEGQRHTRTVYPVAVGRGTVEHWQLHGAGHAWSGGSTQGSYTNPVGVDASAEMLRFFLAHPQ
jgi:poly(hydroxyalkanoate) depolymerase family esterase